MRPLLAVSFYDRRPIEPLLDFLDSLDRHPAGAAYERMLCINATGAPPVPTVVRDRFDDVFERPNAGMNIGAWDAAWRRWPGRDAYVFVQDECYVVRDGWLPSALGAVTAHGIGMAGESLNAAWNRPWSELRTTVGENVLPEHFIDGQPANRVDVYLHHMRRYGIEPGDSGRHLRSLVWVLRGEVLERIGGFPSGANYGECIAAEIGVSRAVESLGLELRELGPLPFHVFRHREWNQDRPGGPFSHKPVMQQELKRLREEVAVLRQRVEQPRFGDVMRMWMRRLRQSGGQR